MSRRYPVPAGTCPTCQLDLIADLDGNQRPHACWTQWDGTPVPWAFYNARRAAAILGVPEAYLHGLINQRPGRGGHQLRAVRVVPFDLVGKRDVPSRHLYNRDDVDTIAATLRTGAR